MVVFTTNIVITHKSPSLQVSFLQLRLSDNNFADHKFTEQGHLVSSLF